MSTFKVLKSGLHKRDPKNKVIVIQTQGFFTEPDTIFDCCYHVYNRVLC